MIYAVLHASLMLFFEHKISKLQIAMVAMVVRELQRKTNQPSNNI